MNKNDSLAIDYAKAFGITLVVMYHLKNSVFNIYHAYMFHMPLFFFIGGVLFKDKPFRLVLKSSLKNHLFYPVKTFIILGVIGVLLGYIFGINNGVVFREGVSGTVIQAYKSNLSNNKLFATAWFLLAYMLCVLLFSVLLTLIRRLPGEPLQTYSLLFIALAAGSTGVVCLSPLYYQTHIMLSLIFSQVLYGMMFFAFGYLLRGKMHFFSSFYLFILLTSVLFILKSYGLATTTGMVWGKYPDGFAGSLFTGMAGIYAVFFISRLLAYSGRQAGFLRLIGQSSKTIMSYHILSFTVIDIMMSYLAGYRLENKDAYLHHYYDKWTLPVYVTAGIIIPLVSLKIYQSLYGKIFYRQAES